MPLSRSQGTYIASKDNQQAAPLTGRKYRPPLIKSGTLTVALLLGDSMLYIVLPFQKEALGLDSLWQVGLLLSVNRGVRLILHPVISGFYRRYSITAGYRIAMLGAILHSLVFALALPFPVLVAARLAWGTAWTFIRQGSQLEIIHVSGNQIGTATGFYLGISRMGSVGGMLAGAIAYTTGSVQTFSACFAILPLFFLPVKFSGLVEKTETKNLNAGSKKINLMIPALIFGLFSSYALHGYFRSTFPVVLENFLGNASTATVVAAIALAIRWAWDPLLAPRFGRYLDRKGSSSVFILLAMLVFLLPAGGFKLPIMAGALIFTLLLGVDSLVTVFSDVFAARTASITDRHRLTSYYSTACDLGAALGPLTGFFLIEKFGPAISGGLIALTVIICGVYFFISKERRRIMEVSS